MLLLVWICVTSLFANTEEESFFPVISGEVREQIEAELEQQFEDTLEKYGPGKIAVYDAFFQANDMWIQNYRLEKIISAIERMTAGNDISVLRITSRDYYMKIIQAKAFALWKFGEHHAALEVFEEMEELLENSLERFKLYDNMALTYATIGEHENAIEYYAKATEGLEESQMGSNYLGVGFVQHSMKNYTAAIKSLSKSVELFDQGRDATLLAKAQKALGSVYMDLDDFSKAESLFRKSMKNFEADNPWDTPLLADVYRMLADSLQAQNQTDNFYIDLLYKSLKIRTVQDKLQLFAAFSIVQTIPNLKCEPGCKLRFAILILKMIERTEGDFTSQAVLYDFLGQIYVMEHDVENAKDAYENSLERYEMYEGSEDVSTMKANAKTIIRMLDSLPRNDEQQAVKIDHEEL